MRSTRRMVDELRDFFGELGADRETRVVVLRGAGRALLRGARPEGSRRRRATGGVPGRLCAGSDASARS